MLKTLRWEDWMGVVLGAWMLVSPWTLGYVDNAPAAMNALVMGTVLILDDTFEFHAYEPAAEWLDVAAGFWLLLSPFALGFATAGPAAMNAVGVGALTMLFAVCALSPFDAWFGHWWHDHAAPGH
jgi:hypothetical protein